MLLWIKSIIMLLQPLVGAIVLLWAAVHTGEMWADRTVTLKGVIGSLILIGLFIFSIIFIHSSLIGG